MNEQRAREILGTRLRREPELNSGRGDYCIWDADDDEICLDGHYTADELEAMSWWMRNKRATDEPQVAEG